MSDPLEVQVHRLGGATGQDESVAELVRPYRAFYAGLIQRLACEGVYRRADRGQDNLPSA